MNEVSCCCPVCGESPVVNEVCPGSCGSLEGLDMELTQKPSNKLFGFPWSKGFVAPFLGVNMKSAWDALKAAGVSSESGTFMVDLGCGDGRICRAAADLGAARAVGYDLDAALIDQASQQICSHSLRDRFSFHVADLFQVDWDPFNLVTLFLLPGTLSDSRMVQKFQDFLDQGGQVISFGWKIPSLGDPVKSSTARRNTLVERWYLYKSR